jgi:hypothetical protein
MIHNKDHEKEPIPVPPPRCIKNKKCVYKYPKAPQHHTQLNANQRVDYKCGPDDAWVVPYAPPLLLLWEGHLNVEAVFTVDVFLYIYKYLFKGLPFLSRPSLRLLMPIIGPDHATLNLKGMRDVSLDARDDSMRMRYISANEAAWRIFGFHISQQVPSVSCLSIHLPDENHHQYRLPQSKSAASESSSLLCYFIRPSHPLFDDMLYATYFTNFIIKKHNGKDPEIAWWEESGVIPNSPAHIVVRCSRGEKVTRLRTVRPGHGDAFYLRLLLLHHSARSFEQLRTINGTQHESFQHAARAAGLLEDEEEGKLAMEDAIANYQLVSQLRFPLCPPHCGGHRWCCRPMGPIQG